MLLTCITCETMKLRRSHLWLAFLLVPLIPAVMGAQNYLNNLNLLKSEWFSLWTQETLFYSNFFFAPLIAVYCSYLWRIENRNQNRHMLLTAPVPVRNIFLGKLISAGKLTLFTQLWVFVLFTISGKLLSLPGLPPGATLFYALRGILGGMVITAWQLFLSMIIKSFATPIGIAVLGSVTGLLVSNSSLAVYYPYSLMLLAMNANRNENMLKGSALPFLISCIFYITFFSASAIWLLKHRDVRT